MLRKKIIKRKPKGFVMMKTRKPKAKVVAKKVAEPKKVEKPAPVSKPIEKPVVKVKIVKYEGAEVLEILEKRNDVYHCKMSNGTTTWIPKSVFE